MTAAARQARRRRRRRAGLTVFKIEADALALADVLVEGGHLAEWDAENHAEIEAALERFVSALANLDAARHA